MPLFQPWYTRLGDAFDGSDVKTAEGDKDDNLDDDEDEDEIIALIETNPIMKKVYFCFLISHNGWQKSISGAKDSLLIPITVIPALFVFGPGSHLVALSRCCLLWNGYYVRDCTVPGEAKEKLLPASRENELFTVKSTNR